MSGKYKGRVNRVYLHFLLLSIYLAFEIESVEPDECAPRLNFHYPVGPTPSSRIKSVKNLIEG